MWGFLTDLTTENSPLGLFNAFCSVIAVQDPSFLREVASTEHQDELLAGSQRPQVRSSLSKKFPIPQGLGLAPSFHAWCQVRPTSAHPLYVQIVALLDQYLSRPQTSRLNTHPQIIFRLVAFLSAGPACFGERSCSDSPSSSVLLVDMAGHCRWVS